MQSNRLTGEEKEAWASREKTAVELYTTEETYVDGIRRLHDIFLNRLRCCNTINRPILTDDQIEKLFGNLALIYNLNKSLLLELRKLRYQGVERLLAGVGDVMIEYVPHFKIYIDYVAGYPEALDVLDKLSSSKKWLEFLEVNEMVAGDVLSSLMIMPIQRLPRYVMLMSTLSKCPIKIEGVSTQSHELDDAVRNVTKVADHVNTQANNMEARKLVVIMQEKLFRHQILLLSPTRYVVHYGDLKKVYTEGRFTVAGHAVGQYNKTFMFILFSDIIICCSNSIGSSGVDLSIHPKWPSSRCRYKHALPLAGMLVDYDTKVPTQKKNEASFHLLTHEVGSDPFICIAPDELTRELWIKKLRRTIKACTDKFETLNKQYPTTSEIEKTILQNADPEFLEDIHEQKSDFSPLSSPSEGSGHGGPPPIPKDARGTDPEL